MLFKPLEHARLMKSRDSSNHFLFFFFSKKKEKNLTISKPCTAGHPLHTICHQMGQPQMHMVTAKTLVCSPSLSSVLTRVCKSSFKIFIYFKKKRLKWPETFLVASELPKDIDAADDLAREDAFYDATLEAVKDAAAMLKKHKIPIQRPGDYYTEMLKTDVHMRKVREKMILETQKVDASDRARKQRQNKKFGKQIQQQILLKRAKDKSSAISDASKGRKGLKQAIANRDDGFDVEVDTGGDGEPASKRSKMTRGKRDSKFGFGGAKNNKRGKRNDSNSYNQSTGKGDRFNVKRNNSTLTRGKSAAGKSGGGAGKRPGKASRAKQKRT